MSLIVPDRLFPKKRICGIFSVIPSWNKNKTVDVHYIKPPNLKSESPILFIMYGSERGDRNWEIDWSSQAMQYNVLILVPKFYWNKYPGVESYNYGNMVSYSGDYVEKRKWTFLIIEELFDIVRYEIGSSADKYLILGRSTGAEFVHRLVLFCSKARIEKAVIADAGRYTFPTFRFRYPYGLGNSPCTEEQLSKALQTNLILLLSQYDLERIDTRRIDNTFSGTNRFELGQEFYKIGCDEADKRGVAFNWDLKMFGSSSYCMPAAESILLRWRRSLPNGTICRRSTEIL